MLVLAAVRKVISDVVQSELPALQAQALGLGKELVAESKSLYEEISSKVDELERIVELSKYSGDDGSEDRLVRHFVNEGRAHPMLAVAQAMQSVLGAKVYPRVIAVSGERQFASRASFIVRILLRTHRKLG